MAEPVAIPGLARFRADLRAVNRQFPAQFRKAEAEAAKIIAEEARGRAPHGTRPLPANRKVRLADAIRPIPSGNSFYVGATAARAPHANVNHWGGTIHPRGVPIHFKRRPFVIEAFDAKRDRFVDLLAEEIDNLASRHGWR